MAGRSRLTSAYLLEGSEPTLVETGPTTSVEAVTTGLRSLGLQPNDLAHIVVTHIHLDHAGGVGRLSQGFPRARVWVHERGAPHLADPTKLVASAARVYGEEQMRSLFGPVDPVPADRLRSVSDGDRISLGTRSLEVMYTPGHASHHVALVDSASGAVFTGDALGIHLPDASVLRPAMSENLRVEVCSTRNGALEILQHKRGAAFAEHNPIVVLVVRTKHPAERGLPPRRTPPMSPGRSVHRSRPRASSIRSSLGRAARTRLRYVRQRGVGSIRSRLRARSPEYCRRRRSGRCRPPGRPRQRARCRMRRRRGRSSAT